MDFSMFGRPLSNFQYQPRHARQQPSHFMADPPFLSRPCYYDEVSYSPNAYAGRQRSMWSDFPWTPSFGMSPYDNYSAKPSHIRRRRTATTKPAENSQVNQTHSRQELENDNSSTGSASSNRAVADARPDDLHTDECLTTEGVPQELDALHSAQEDRSSRVEVGLPQTTSEEVDQPIYQGLEDVSDGVEGGNSQQQDVEGGVEDDGGQASVLSSASDDGEISQIDQHVSEESGSCSSEDSDASREQDLPKTQQISEEISLIESLLKGASEYLSAIDSFDGSSGDKQYLILSESLMSIVLKLDLIDTHGHAEVRQARRDAVRTIQGALQVLDSKCSL